MGAVAAFLIGALWVAVGLVQVVASYAGLEAWLGWSSWVLVAILVVALFFFRLTIILIPLSFYGAWRGWGWEWWQAALLAGSGFIPMLFIAPVAAFQQWRENRRYG